MPRQLPGFVWMAAILSGLSCGWADRARADERSGNVLVDPTRPVTRITRESFDLAYFTSQACETRVQVRRGVGPADSVAARGLGKRTDDPWAAADVRIVNGADGQRNVHHVTVEGLQSGERYFYRVYDPGIEPSTQESRWGAKAPWRREFAVSTLAPAGKKTLVRYPVLVLLMPNVVNLESAFADAAAPATEPVRVTDEQMRQVREELDRASRCFFVNSRMRLWVDFTVVVDDRWQRWGPEPAAATEFCKGWPICRSYAGEDYHSPGGGRFTFVDVNDPQRVVEQPIAQSRTFYGQVEIPFPRRWDAAKKTWTYYTSGGGTLGVDSIPDGIPARSQYFGGYDTAWLTSHEVHHQLESLGAFSLANREDERIVFNHWSPRSRTRGPDAASGPEGSRGMHPWSTSGRHGEHYDGMAFWDRTLSDAQWLRMFLTETEVVTDADNDGFPDDDARLPIDEHRFGSRSDSATTDGRLNDLDKAMLSTWAPAPLQAAFAKPTQTFARPQPTRTDSDGDGVDDAIDPAPLIPHEPFVWPLSATIDGDGAEWEGVPLAGVINLPDIGVEFKQAYDERAYCGQIRLRGDWRLARLVLDPEGEGAYSTNTVQAIRVLNGEPIKVDSKDRFFPRAPALRSAFRTGPDGWTTVEFSLPNGGDGLMYWRGAGREIGSYLELTDNQGGIRSMHEPYRFFSCRMLERAGQAPMPGTPPAEITPDMPGVVTLIPGDGRLKTRGGGWKLEGETYRHSGPGEASVYVDGLNGAEFDLWARVECASDAILGAFTAQTPRMGATHDYVAFVGGYSNTRSRLRLFGSEAGDTPAVVTPGKHTMQLSRRDGVVFCLWDGKAALWAFDPEPGKVVDRLAVLGGYDGRQVLHEVRYRVVSAATGALESTRPDVAPPR